MDSPISLFRHGPLTCALACQLLTAQAQTPARAANPVEAAASSQVEDWAKRAAARPFFWIKVNAQRGDDKPQPGAVLPSSAPARAPVTAARKAVEPATAATPVVTRSGAEPGLTAAPNGDGVSAIDQPLPRADAVQPPLPAAASAEPGSATSAMSAPATQVSTTSAPAPAEADKPATTGGLSPAQEDPPVQLALLQGEEPHFSARVMRELRQGHIDLEIQIDAEGRVQEVHVARASDTRLRRPALAASRDWRFTPPHKPVSAVVSLGFNLDAQ